MLTGVGDVNAVLGLDLSTEQWAAIDSPLAPAVLVAGAGSGKTTSMAARVAWLVGSGQVQPDRILGLTFTTKATGELLGRVRQALTAVHAAIDETGAADPVIQTYHAFATQIVREHGIRIGREPTATILTEAARASLAYRFVCTTEFPVEMLNAAPKTVVEHLLHLDDALVEVDVDIATLRGFDQRLIDDLSKTPKPIKKTNDMIEAARSRLILADLVGAWRGYKADHDVLDFGDQIRLALEIVRTFPHIAQELRSDFDVVLLDEYQDTSLAQHHLLHTIFGPGHAVTAVGDPCQAIYGWRGASVANIEQFPEHYGSEVPADRYPLSVNRRSGSRIVALANEIAAPLRAEHRGVEPLGALQERGSGQVACALFHTRSDEVSWIVDDIERVGSATDGAWGEIAILTATSEGVLEFDRALRARGIPTQVYGVESLLAHPVIMEIRAYLEVMHDVTANPWLLRIATNERWAIGPRDLAALGARAKELAGAQHRPPRRDVTEALIAVVNEGEPVETISLREALADLGDPHAYSAAAFERLGALDRQLRQLGQLVGAPIMEVLHGVLTITGLDVEVNIVGEHPFQVADRRRAVRSFLQLAYETSRDVNPTLGGFLVALREAERFDVSIPTEQLRRESAVHILTVHKAKGLEFPRVYVPFMSADVFPNGKGVSSWVTSSERIPWELRDDCPDALRGFPNRVEGPRTKDFESYTARLRVLKDLEDRRLAYVAMTRAEQYLCVTGHWWGHDQKEPKGPHPFLLEMHERCIGGLGVVPVWVPEVDIADANPSPVANPEPVPWPAPQDRGAHLQQQARAVRTASGTAAPASAPAAWRSAVDILLAEERARRSELRIVRLPEAISATTWIQAQSDPARLAAQLARPMPQRPSRAAERGSQLHSYIEHRLGQQSLIDPFDLPGAADDFITSDEHLRQLQEAFEASEFAGRSAVATERPFAVLLHGRVIRGRIDAVFAVGDRFQVVDWKTGTHVEPLQLALYRAAWAQIAGVSQDQVDVAFYLIGPNHLIVPEEIPLLQVDLLAEP